MTYPYQDPNQQQYQQGPPPGYQQPYQQPAPPAYGPPPGYQQPYQQPAPGQPQQWAPPQQGQQWAPPGQQYQPNQPEGPAPIQGTLDDFFSQQSTGGGAPWKFENVGDQHFGIVRREITDADTEQQMTLGQNPQPATFKDGRAKLVMRVPLNVAPSAEDPDGEAQWYCRGSSRDLLLAAMAQVGAPAGPPEVGSGIFVKYIANGRAVAGMNPQKKYTVQYWRPDQAAGIAAQLGISMPAIPQPGNVPASTPAVAPQPEMPAPAAPPAAPQQYPGQDAPAGAPQFAPPVAPQQGYPQPGQQFPGQAQDVPAGMPMGQPQYAAQGAPQGGPYDAAAGMVAQGQHPVQQAAAQANPAQQWGPPPGAPAVGAPGMAPPPPVTWNPAAGGAPQAGYVPQPQGGPQQGQPQQGQPQQQGGGLMDQLTGR